MSNNTVSVAQFKRLLTNCITHDPAGFRPLVLGAPGVAKTAAVRQVAESIGYTLVEVILSQYTPEQISGYPYIENGVMKYARPVWWPTDSKVMLLFDEIGQCPIANQNLAMQIINDRRVGQHVLPDDCIVLGAGNRSEDRAGSTVMHTALRSRFFPVVTLEPEKAEWVDHAIEVSMNPIIIAYVKSIRRNVLDFDPKNKGGFVCPRTLEQAGKLMAAHGNDADSPDLKAGLYGILGDNDASQVLAYMATITRMPSYDDVHADPLGAAVCPDLVDPIARMLAGNARYSHLSSVVRYIERYDRESQVRLVTALPEHFNAHPAVTEIRKQLAID